MLISESQLLARAREVLRPFGCEVSALGPSGMQPREFGHIYGPSVIVRALTVGPTAETLARMTKEVTSKVSGITGVSLAGLAHGVAAE